MKKNKSQLKRLFFILPALLIAVGAGAVAATRWLTVQIGPQDSLGEENGLLGAISSRIMPQVTLGIEDGALAPCPAETMNCVNSRSDRPYSAIEPLRFDGTKEEAKARIKSILEAMPRTELVSEDKDYVHFTDRSAVFGFVDDVEFQFDEQARIIHFRSAARLGYGDLGVNRSRMEAIREALSAE